MRVAFASDHAGPPLYDAVREAIKAHGAELVDLTPPPGARVDYPSYAGKLVTAIAEGKADLGVLICGTGIGMSIAANKHKGIRAAVVRDGYEAKMARAHNDANVLCLGARVIGPGVAEDCVRIFLATEFEGGRHAARVAMFEGDNS